MPFFSHQPNFSDFVFTVWNVIYDTYMALSSLEKSLFHKRNPRWHQFLLSSYFPTHPTTLLLKILGDGCMGHPSHLKFWGRQSPLSLRPCGSPSVSPLGMASFFYLLISSLAHKNFLLCQGILVCVGSGAIRQSTLDAPTLLGFSPVEFSWFVAFDEVTLPKDDKLLIFTYWFQT